MAEGPSFRDLVLALGACALGACGAPAAPIPPPSGAPSPVPSARGAPVRIAAALLPLANLDVVTSYPGISFDAPSRQIDIVGPNLVVQGYASWVRPLVTPMEAASFDVATGAPIATFAPVGSLNMEDTREGPEVFLHPVGNLLVGMNPGGIFAIDPVTGTRRWQTVLYDATTLARMQPKPWPHNRVWPAKVGAANGTLYVLVEEAHSPPGNKLGLDENIELIALDASTGAIGWRAPLAGFDILHEPALDLFVTDSAVVIRRGHELHGFAEGKRLWTTQGGDIVFGDRTTLVVVDAGMFFAIDPKTGNAGPKRTDDVPHTTAASLDGGVLYGLARNDDGVRLVATHASDGQPLWQSSPIRETAPNLLPPLASGDAVYACLGGSMVAFDRASGAIAYTKNVGGCAIGGIAEATSTRDAVVVVTTGTDGRPTGFARTTTRRPERNVRVTGSVRLECIPQASTTVWIDDTRTTTDASGRFGVTISTRGLVRVDAAAKGQMVAADGKLHSSGANSIRDLPPDASGNARADFDFHMRTNCGDDYTPIPCKPVRTACPH